MELQDQIYSTWLPLVITLIFGLIGLIRGVVREVLVAASVVLGAFVVSQWAGQWSGGLFQFYNGIAQEQQQFYLSIGVLWLIVLVIGYGLGIYMPRERPRALSRLAGGLLGIASGAALAGWSLRYSITTVEGALRQGFLLDDPVSRGFMIWANWFPIMLVLLGALLAILVPVRRAQRAIAEPSDATDWEPTARPAPAPATAGSATPAPVPAPIPARSVPSSSAAAPPAYDPQAATQPYAARPYGAPLATSSPEDAPATSLLPTAEPTTTLRSAADRPAAQTRQFNTMPPSDSSDTISPFGGSPSSTSGPASEPSWLLQSVQDTERGEGASNSPTGNASKETRPYATITPTGTGASQDSKPVTGGEQPGARKCPNCGSTVLPGAFFCTECGTRVT
jgi:hypothetical protein